MPKVNLSPFIVIARRAMPDVAISTWTTGDPHVASLLGMNGTGNRLHMGPGAFWWVLVGFMGSGGFYGFWWGDLGR